jgi:hypothetical protein
MFRNVSGEVRVYTFTWRGLAGGPWSRDRTAAIPAPFSASISPRRPLGGQVV